MKPEITPEVFQIFELMQCCKVNYHEYLNGGRGSLKAYKKFMQNLRSVKNLITPARKQLVINEDKRKEGKGKEPAAIAAELFML